MCAHLLGLKPDDFSAYQPERASSNAFSRPRLEFKQRAVAWARSVVERLATLGIPMQVHASDEHPSIWNGHKVDKQMVLFSRDESARDDIDLLLEERRSFAERVQDPSPYRRHALLAFLIDAEHVEVSTQVHPNAWVDFETFEARLSDPSTAEGIVSQIRELPEQFQLGVHRQSLVPSSDITVEHLQSLLEESKKLDAPLWIGWSIDKDTATSNSELLDEQLQDALIALAPLYMKLSWREDDDPANMRTKLEQMRQQRQEAEARRSEQNKKLQEEKAREKQQKQDESRKQTMERVQYAPPRKNISLANLFRNDSTPSSRDQTSPRQDRKRRSSNVSQAVPTERGSSPKKTPRRAPADHEQHRTSSHVKRRAPRPSYQNADGEIRVGSQVRVQSGAFAGKIGIVKQLDAKGSARVLLGLLSARIDSSDLQLVTAQTKTPRPALQSSHRGLPTGKGKNGQNS